MRSFFFFPVEVLELDHAALNALLAVFPIYWQKNSGNRIGEMPQRDLSGSTRAGGTLNIFGKQPPRGSSHQCRYVFNAGSSII